MSQDNLIAVRQFPSSNESKFDDELFDDIMSKSKRDPLTGMKEVESRGGGSRNGMSVLPVVTDVLGNVEVRQTGLSVPQPLHRENIVNSYTSSGQAQAQAAITALTQRQNESNQHVDNNNVVPVLMHHYHYFPDEQRQTSVSRNFKTSIENTTSSSGEGCSHHHAALAGTVSTGTSTPINSTEQRARFDNFSRMHNTDFFNAPSIKSLSSEPSPQANITDQAQYLRFQQERISLHETFLEQTMGSAAELNHSTTMGTTKNATENNNTKYNAIAATHNSFKMELSTSSEQGSSHDEGKCRDDDGSAISIASTASATTLSPSLLPLTGPVEEEPGHERLPAAAIGTPSTVSTAFSVEEASVDGQDDLTLKFDIASPSSAPVVPSRTTPLIPAARRTDYNNMVEIGRPPRSSSHRRTLSWENGEMVSDTNVAHRGVSIASDQQVQPWQRHSSSQSPGPGSYARAAHREPPRSGAASQVRIATFRSEQSEQTRQMRTLSQVAASDAWKLQRRVPIAPGSDSQHHVVDHGHGHGFVPSRRPEGHTPAPQGRGQVHSMTPPRGRHSRTGQRQQGSPLLGGSSGPSSSNAGSHGRSSSEVLKTLLRKKACLYEPDTSRAVSLVTWLVGRELALEFGYFSRQQLQSGVHACVAEKIDTGTITRTKVNRCMQIILNSCFHYIIPRPDGTEENGESFRHVFAESSTDDSHLLAELAKPWDNIMVSRESVLQASAIAGEDGKGDVKRQGDGGAPSKSPDSSPRIGSVQATAEGGDLDAGTKRAVLLCFNENVRCAEDVLRCHNEFIRDTANASNLQLTAQEWHSFFGRDTTGTPMMWNGIEIDGVHGERLGRMTSDEVLKFRTTWCAKRYEHDHDLCGFAHVEVNGGWLRRNPSVNRYGYTMCQSVLPISDKRPGHPDFTINECTKGTKCEFAHSKEEIIYHPERYKKNMCVAVSHSQGCTAGDLCPFFHPHDSHHHSTTTKKHSGDGRSPYRRHHDHRHHHHHHHPSYASHGKGVTGMPPEGSPMLYVSPAPLSSFERQLALPGLQGIFRRHSSVVRSNLQSGTKCFYSPFGDDWGIIRGGPTLRPPVKGWSPEGNPQPQQQSQQQLP